MKDVLLSGVNRVVSVVLCLRLFAWFCKRCGAHYPTMSADSPALPAAYVRGKTDIYEYLHSVLEKRIMILDGAMGTMIQTHKLGEAE